MVNTAKMTVFEQMGRHGGTEYLVKREGVEGYVMRTQNRRKAAEYAGRAAEWVKVRPVKTGHPSPLDMRRERWGCE